MAYFLVIYNQLINNTETSLNVFGEKGAPSNRVFQISLRARGKSPLVGWNGKFYCEDFSIGWWESDE